METIDAVDAGKRACVPGLPGMSDLELLSEIKRLESSVASWGAAMLLSAYKAEAVRRGFKEV